MYRAAERVGTVHFGAVRKAISGKPVWVGTDEWTDSQGHAIINILMGCCSAVYVVACVQLDCKGPNLGVEHGELGSAVVDSLTKMSVSPSDVFAFVSDSASVLKKAYDEVLKPVCRSAKWVPCTSHKLNNIGKTLVTAFDDGITKLFENGPSLLHAKRFVLLVLFRHSIPNFSLWSDMLPEDDVGLLSCGTSRQKLHYLPSTSQQGGPFGVMCALGGSATLTCFTDFAKQRQACPFTVYTHAFIRLTFSTLR